MNKTVWIVIAVAAALFVSLPFLAQLAHRAPAVENAPAQDGGAGETAPATSATQVPAWNAGNLTGTAWNAKGFTVQLGAGGVATANTPIGAVSGTWTVSGSALTISAMGRTINGQISGDQILVDGQPVQRVQ